MIPIALILAVAGVTFAILFRTPAKPRPGTLIQQEFETILQKIRGAEFYVEITNIETLIDDFDYKFNHETDCAKYVNILLDEYTEKRYEILNILAVAN